MDSSTISCSKRSRCHSPHRYARHVPVWSTCPIIGNTFPFKLTGVPLVASVSSSILPGALCSREMPLGEACCCVCLSVADQTLVLCPLYRLHYSDVSCSAAACCRLYSAIYSIRPTTPSFYFAEISGNSEQLSLKTRTLAMIQHDLASSVSRIYGWYKQLLEILVWSSFRG